MITLISFLNIYISIFYQYRVNSLKDIDEVDNIEPSWNSKYYLITFLSLFTYIDLIDFVMESDFSQNRLERARVSEDLFRSSCLRANEKSHLIVRASTRRRKSIKTIGKTTEPHILF
jgi:hypothetical protein